MKGKFKIHSFRAGLQFLVGRIHCLCKGHYVEYVEGGALVYLAVMAAYVLAEQLELVDNVAHMRSVRDGVGGSNDSSKIWRVFARVKTAFTPPFPQRIIRKQGKGVNFFNR